MLSTIGMKLAQSIFAAPWLLTACASAPMKNPTLCQLAENREAYAGRSLTVEGFLLVSRLGTVVSDPTCGLCIGISWNDNAPQMRAHNAAIDRSQWESMMARVRVTGEVKLGDGNSLIDGPAWELDLTVAEVLSARQLPEEDAIRYLDWLDGPSEGPFQPSR